MQLDESSIDNDGMVQFLVMVAELFPAFVPSSSLVIIALLKQPSKRHSRSVVHRKLTVHSTDIITLLYDLLPIYQ